MVLTGHLPVSHGHSIYYELHGNKHGKKAVIVHGGPGGGMNKSLLHMFELKKWSVLLFDQRGCGKSTPFGSIEHNTTWDLVADMEALRCFLGWNSWFIQGGSWGTTLALAYAETHPSHVSGLLLRGVCLCDEPSFKWLYERGGASEVFPEKWASFVSVLPPRLHEAGWKEIATYFQKKLNSTNHALAQKYADAWWGWEAAVSYLYPRKDDSSKKEAIAIARLENHYFLNKCWLSDDQLIKNAHKLRRIPITIVHGRYDMVCPIISPTRLVKELPHIKMIILPHSGHASSEPATIKALNQAVKTMYRRIPTKRFIEARKKRKE